MKILITANNSYIGNSVKSWLDQFEPTFIVNKISLRDIELKNYSFKEYDVIIHVAGIAHITTNRKLKAKYFEVNKDLAIEVASKAKKDGVKQLIFTSTISVYGNDRPIGDYKPVEILKPSPSNDYGQSKLEADLGIQKLQDKDFIVSIIRVPMVYGITAKGNFLKLINISSKISIFPKLKNIRSVIHINNLSELVRLIIINKTGGVFLPQDKKYFDTTEFISLYRSYYGKNTFFIPFLSLPLMFIGFFIKSLNKLYGNKFYEIAESKIKDFNYQLFSVNDVIKELSDI
jgi:nucleoside-diphosphate-sugar epimerase